jgi:hypothetical protein
VYFDLEMRIGSVGYVEEILYLEITLWVAAVAAE